MFKKDNTCIYGDVDYTEKEVGGYKVISFSHIKEYSSKNRIRYWNVECIHCGNKKKLAAQKVVQSFQDGCSKCKSERFRGAKSKLWSSDVVEYVPGMYYKKTIGSAKKRNIPFEITREDMDRQFISQKGKCVYTDLDISFGSKDERPTASIDRIDSTKGYTVDNIQWVHKNVNYMKMDMSETQFLEMCKLIADRTEKINEYRTK